MDIISIRSNYKSYLLNFRTFVFELWAEEEKLLGNLDLISALAAFYHTCFVFDLKYPVVRYLKICSEISYDMNVFNTSI